MMLRGSAVVLVLLTTSAVAQNTFPTSGKAGIGTTSPNNLLEMSGGAFDFYNPGEWVAVGLDYDPSSDTLRFRSNNAGSNLNQTNISIQRVSGRVGIGTTTPQSALEVIGDFGFAYGNSIKVGQENGGWTNPSFNLVTTGWDSGDGGTDFAEYWTPGNNGRTTPVLTMRSNGNVGIATTTPGYALDVAGGIHASSAIVAGAGVTFPDGTSQTTAFNSTLCGGDYAESVDVTGDRKSFAPGDILVIDPDHPGKFLKSDEPYSTSVTGIYSTKPGALGRRQLTAKSPEEVPMAMVGIVPTKVSAENGAIKPGDLLVTASTPGVAMKGTDRGRMLGAVIGKALGGLESGIGTVEVVVTLQ